MAWVSRRRAMIEAITNTTIGFIVTPLVWFFFLIPVLELEHSWQTSWSILLTLAVSGTARSYLLRRYFHRSHK